MLKLNDQQHDAIHYTRGHVMVLAGAGSGKTRVITEKIAHLIQNEGFPARSIYAVTFTNKAAKEMRHRIQGTLGSQATQGLSISTFHTLGLNILRFEHEHLGYKAKFSIFDAADSASVLKELLRENDEGQAGDEQVVKWAISNLKNDLIFPEQALSQAKTNNDVAIAKLYARYQRQLLAYNAVDFDDLIMQPIKLFRENSDVLTRWQGRIQHLLVDEYQDTNTSQYELIKLLLGHRGKLTAVGDDDQSIYAWRGAKIENISQLSVDYPSLRVIKLEQNYRSMGRILNCANILIRNNPHEFEKQLWSDFGLGDKVKIVPTKDENDEAERVVSEIIRQKFSGDSQYKDMAILYRGNFQSRAFAEVLRSHNIPYKLSGGQDFFQYTEIKDVLAYLRLIANPEDDAAFLRIINTPRREIGTVTLEKLGSFARKNESTLLAACAHPELAASLKEKPRARLSNFAHWITELQMKSDTTNAVDMTRHVLSETAYESWLLDSIKNKDQAKKKMDNIKELVTWIERMVKKHKEDNDEELSLYQLISKITLMDILDRQNEEEELNAVNLMTLHAAKGLEFRHVFLTGVEEEILPHHTSIVEDSVEEERRLCYVGITRARRTLVITYANKRRRGSDFATCTPSRFLDELPEDDIIWEGKEDSDKTVSKETARANFDMMRQMLSQSNSK